MGSDFNIGAVILAAGVSSRLGKPKQLVPFRGKPLVKHMVDAVEAMDLKMRLVVLGAHEQVIRKQVDFKKVQVISNQNWEEGMASGIRLAVDHASELKLDAMLILLSDQPFVNTVLLNALMDHYVPGKQLIVASAYRGILGVPALFDQHYFKELAALKGEAGARKVIKTHQNKVKGVKFEEGVIDIDTPEDLEQLKSTNDGGYS